MDDPALWIALAAALAGGFFASCHVALKSFSRARLSDRLEQAGHGHVFQWLIDRRPHLLLMTGTFRTCLSLTVLLGVLAYVETHFFQGDAVDQRVKRYAAALLFAGALVSVLVVAIPESLARYAPEKVLVRSRGILRFFLLIFRPAELVLRLFDPVVRRLAGSDEDEDDESELSDEVLSVVEDHEGGAGVDDVQKEMLEAVFEFRSTAVDEIMTPRTDIRGIEVSSDLASIKATILDSGFSRLPVYEETIDNIVGILYAKELIRFIKANGEQHEPFDLRKTMRPAVMVPETKPVHELLTEMKAQQVHIAIVLDEYGGTAGIVTVEDIIEEIVGEINDEHEPATKREPEIRMIEDGMAEVDARVYVDDLNDAMGLELPEDEDYDTVGGFVFSTLGHVPQQDESFEYEDVRIVVTDVERTRINRIRVELLESHVSRRNGKTNDTARSA